MKTISHLFCTAPMLDITDRHARFLYRLLSKNALLYSEMIHANAILQGDTQRFLQFNPQEHPISLQIGGSNPDSLASAAKIGQDFGYDEINLNCGCPSPKVQAGDFGVCMMKDTNLVTRILNKMQESVRIPVTIKIRIGLDELDSPEFLFNFLDRVSTLSPCQTFIIHARKAWLKGLSPKQNREIPPLNYARVYEAKKLFPNLNIVINGGISSFEDIYEHLRHVDGVMLGRHICEKPLFLSKVDSRIFCENNNNFNFSEDNFNINNTELKKLLDTLLSYADKQMLMGIKLHNITKSWQGIFHTKSGARALRFALQSANSTDELSKKIQEYLN